MSITFTNARIIDPDLGRDFPGSLCVEEGIIAQIDGPHRGKILDCRGACLAPGIVDIGVKVCEPGERHIESFRTASCAAVARSCCGGG